MPTSSSLVAPEVIMTTTNVASGEVGIMTTHGFQCAIQISTRTLTNKITFAFHNVNDNFCWWY